MSVSAMGWRNIGVILPSSEISAFGWKSLEILYSYGLKKMLSEESAFVPGSQYVHDIT